MIHTVDTFVLLDTVKYTHQDWRNRNRIKTASGFSWLTIPMDHTTTRYDSSLQDACIRDPNWWQIHLRRLRENYRTAPCCDDMIPYIEEMYRSAPFPKLIDVNEHCIRYLCDLLGISTPITKASQMPDEAGKNERILNICKELGATIYLSGPSAKGYLDEAVFESAGIQIEYIHYDHFAEYNQVHPPFRHDVTILDPILHAGNGVRDLIIPSIQQQIHA